MKILHTSDWHLGQKFLTNDRKAEHEMALEWLYRTIEEANVDVLIVAGDVFDIGNPPSYARTLYYRFLTKLQGSCCQHIIIVGGNHDSPAMLNAPKELLHILNVHVVGAATGDLADEIIELKDASGKLKSVIAAVPFLRDRDIRQSVSGESGLERMAKVQEGIVRHFQQIGAAIGERQVPVIATGHLYAKGALASDKQDNIYIGDIENIEGDHFPKVFDYVALGHIHRAQLVGEQQHVRYCGSIIPLSFSEIQDSKIVLIVEFDGKKLTNIQEVKIPRFRELVTFSGDLASIKGKLERFDPKRKGKLIPWVDINIEMEENIPNLDGEIRAFAKDMWMEILKIRTRRPHSALESMAEEISLDDLSPEEVFLKKCNSGGEMPEAEKTELLSTFRALGEWMMEREEG
ncbi:MAG: exonuclease SbcCD subunit D C-terminal domain-containing protein [Bacteroidota bacterium]